jgi:DnaK suppressor protein
MSAKRTPVRKPGSDAKAASGQRRSPAASTPKTAAASKKAAAKKPEKPPRSKKPAKPAPKPAKAKAKPVKAAPARSARVRGAGTAVRERKRPAETDARVQRPALDLAAFRAQLLQKQKELLQAYTSTKGDSRSRQSDGTEDYIDYAVSSYDREFLLSLTELEQNQLILVEEALRRIDRGEYGRCSQCDQPIPAKRLQVQPWARHCVGCQELEEQGLARESPETLPDEDDLEASTEDDIEPEIDYDDEPDGIDADDDDEPGDEDRLIGG